MCQCISVYLYQYFRAFDFWHFSDNLLVITVFSSGYIFGKYNGTSLDNQGASLNNQTTTTRPDFIPKINLPAGFTYRSIHETKVDINGAQLSAIEGISLVIV